MKKLFIVFLHTALLSSQPQVDSIIANHIILCTGPSRDRKQMLIDVTQRDAQIIPFKKIFIATNDPNNCDIAIEGIKTVVEFFQERGKQLDCINCIIASIKMAVNDPEATDDDIILFKHESVYISDMNLFRKALGKLCQGYDMVAKYWIGFPEQAIPTMLNDYYHTDSFLITVAAARKIFADHTLLRSFTAEYQFCEEYFTNHIVNKVLKVYKIDYHHSSWKDNELGFYHIPRQEHDAAWYWDKKNYDEIYER